MAWDKSLPATDEKIRNLSSVITANWAAIEEGDETTGTPIFQRAILLGDRTVIATADDPTVVGATTYVYSKQDAGAVQEAFIKDAASNEIQITQGGRLGSDVTAVGFNTLSNDAGTTVYDERNLVAYWVTVNAAGTIQAQSETGGVTVVRTAGTSRYTVTFATAQLTSTYGVNVTPFGTPSTFSFDAHVDTVGTGSFRVNITQSDGSAVTGGTAFTATVYGGRPT